MPVDYKFGLHALEFTKPPSFDSTSTVIKRPAKTATGDVWVLIQGREFDQFALPLQLIDGTQTAQAQSEALNDEIGRPYLITIEGQKWVTTGNSLGRMFGCLTGMGQKTQTGGSSEIYSTQLEGYVMGGWDKFRRCRQFYPVPVTSNDFGLTGTFEIPLASLDGALDFNGTTQYTWLGSGVSSDLDISSGVLEL